MSNSFDWLTRLLYSFTNHDTSLTLILNLHFANKNAFMLEPKMEKNSLHRQEQGQEYGTEVSKLK